MLAARKKSRFTWRRLLRHFAQLGYLFLLAFSAYNENFTIIIILLILSLFGGAFFCGWLCPLGMAQEWLGRLGHQLLGGKRIKVPAKIERLLVFSRYFLLVAGLTGLGVFAFTYFISEPYQAFMGLITAQWSYIGLSVWLYLELLFLMSLFIDRPFCRYLCVQGAQYGALSLLRVFSIGRNAKLCINCRLCDKACPTQVVISTKNHVRNPQCVNCLDCIDACPVKGALKYKWVLPITKGRPINRKLIEKRGTANEQNVNAQCSISHKD